MNYWVGVMIGCCTSVILFGCLTFGLVEQNVRLRTEIKAEVKELSEKVAEHDEIMQAYAFYNWKMSFFEEER